MKFYIAGITIEDDNLSFDISSNLLLKSIPQIIKDSKASIDENGILIIILHEGALTHKAISNQEKENFLTDLQVAIAEEKNVILIPGSFAIYKTRESDESRLEKNKKIQERYSFLCSLPAYKTEFNAMEHKYFGHKLFEQEEINIQAKKEEICSNKKIVFFENTAYILTSQDRIKHKKSFPFNDEMYLSEEQKSNYIFNVGTEILPRTLTLSNGKTIDLRVLICREHFKAKEANDEIDRPFIEVITSNIIQMDKEKLFGALSIQMDRLLHLSVNLNRLHEKASQITSVDARHFTISANPYSINSKPIICTYFEGVNVIKNYPLDKTSPLSLAILNDHSDSSLIAMMEADGNLSSPDRSGFQPLHYAVVKNRPEVLLHLLSKKIDINERIEYSENTLHGRDLGKNLSLHEATALHIAASMNNLSMAKLLLSNGADINAKTKIGLTPLAFAAIKGLEVMFDFLLENGASSDLNIQIPKDLYTEERSIFDDLLFYNRGAILIWKLNKVDRLVVSAALHGKNSIVSKCLERGIYSDKDTKCLFQIATQNKRIDLFYLLFKHAIDTGFAGLDKTDLIDKAWRFVLYSDTIPGMIGNTCYEEISELLMEFDPELKILETSHSFDKAAALAYTSGFKKLLNKILKFLQPQDLILLLDRALFRNDFLLVESLVTQRKADVDQVLSVFINLFRCKQIKMCRFVLQLGMSILREFPIRKDLSFPSLFRASLEENFKFYPIILDSLKNENKGKINQLDSNARCFLHYAVELKKTQVVKDLLALGADPMIKDRLGNTAMDYLNESEFSKEELEELTLLFTGEMHEEIISMTM